MDKNITPLKADLILLIVAFLWGSNYVVTKTSINVVEPMQVVLFRFSIASALSLIFFGKNLRNTTKEEIKAGVLLGIFLGLGLFFSLYGIKYTTVSNNSFIVSTNVVMVPFIYWAICKKRPSAMSIWAVFVMAVGLAFLTLNFNDGFKINKGDLISMGCVLFYASHVVLSDVFAKKYNPVSVNTIAMTVTALMSVIFLVARGEFIINVPKSALGELIYLAVFPTFVCFTLQLFCQRYTTAPHAAIIISLESVFATLLAIIFLKEKLTFNMSVGFVCIFISVLSSELGDYALVWLKERKKAKITHLDNLNF